MFNKNFICIICFFTINLYNFILLILNNFLKTYLKIITKGFTDGLYPSALDILVTNLQTELIRRHFAVAWCKFHNHRWPDRRKYYVGISHTHQWNKFVGIFQAGILFFWRSIFVSKTIGNFFLPTDLATEWGITHELWITDWWNIFVSKTVKSCSVINLLVMYIIYQQ